MLMVFLAMAFQLESLSKQVARDNVYVSSIRLIGNVSFRPVEKPFTLSPRWQVEGCKQNDNDSAYSTESNYEQWQKLTLAVKIDEIAPRIAIQKSTLSIAKERDNIWRQKMMEMNALPLSMPVYQITVSDDMRTRIVSYVTPELSHCPWHLGIQRDWPGYFSNRNILVYDVIKTPSTRNPYYEAIVCSMPNIRCKAKTIELLEQQLLQQYASYLLNLMETENGSTFQPNNQSLDGSFIAFLVFGPTIEKPREFQTFPYGYTPGVVFDF